MLSGSQKNLSKNLADIYKIIPFLHSHELQALQKRISEEKLVRKEKFDDKIYSLIERFFEKLPKKFQSIFVFNDKYSISYSYDIEYSKIYKIDLEPNDETMEKSNSSSSGFISIDFIDNTIEIGVPYVGDQKYFSTGAIFYYGEHGKVKFDHYPGFDEQYYNHHREFGTWLIENFDFTELKEAFNV